MKLIPHLTLSTLTLALLLALTGGAYAASRDDKTDRLSANQSYTFSPGYINAAKQRAENILIQTIPEEDGEQDETNKIINFVQNRLAASLNEKQDSNMSVKPELKMKSSAMGSGNTGDSFVQSPADILVDSAKYEVSIKSGSKQEYANDRLVAEEINGIRHIYVGFDTVGYDKAELQNVINQKASAGDIIMLRGGVTYNGDITLANGTRIYGGYNENGLRNISGNASEIYGTVYANGITRLTELNGFRITSAKSWGTGISINNSNNQLKILNNTVDFSKNGGYSSIYAYKSSAVIFNNILGIKNYAAVINSNNSSLTVESNIIYSPYSGAVNEYMSNSTYRNNIFWGTSYYGSMFLISRGSAPTIDRNTFYSNSSVIISSVYSSPTVTNNAYAGKGSFLSVLGDSKSSGNVYDAAINLSLGRYSSAAGKGYSSDIINYSYGQTTLTPYKAASLTSPFNISPFSTDHLQGMSNRSIPGMYDISFSARNANAEQRQMSADTIAAMLKGLIKNKNEMTIASAGSEGRELFLETMERIAAEKDAVSLRSAWMPTDDEVGMAAILAGIIENPNENQKSILSSVEVIMNEINSIGGEAGASSRLVKAQNELIQMVANVLLAQAMPDLINKGELANIKGIFKELDIQKTRIMQDYNEATAPYYGSIEKDLTKNMAALQLTSIFSKGMLENELRNASRSQIEKIIEKLKASSEKSFEKDYILQQEAKYKDKYLDSNKKKLESDMRNMMNGFTGRLQEALEAKGK